MHESDHCSNKTQVAHKVRKSCGGSLRRLITLVCYLEEVMATFGDDDDAAAATVAAATIGFG